MFKKDEIAYLDKKKTVKIVYQDDDLLVVEKPAGLTVHPAESEKGETLSEMLFKIFPENKIKPFPGIVHRLDKETSGLLIMAKNNLVKELLQSQFKKRKVKKRYLALVDGIVTPKAAVIMLPLARKSTDRTKYSAKADGLVAKPTYRTIKNYTDKTLLELEPETGRTHQIRVHLAEISHPIIGDKKYGKESKDLSRLFLHAAYLCFSHPVKKQPMEFESSLPSTLKNYLETLD